MEGVHFVEKGSKLFAIIVKNQADSANKYNFLTAKEEPLQLGINNYTGGEKIKSHRHLPKNANITKLQEYILIRSGKIRLHLFDDAQQKIGEYLLGNGDSVLLLDGGHGFDIIEDTSILEIKQGPFTEGKDKVHFE